MITYYLILLDFWHDEYKIFEYQKSRRYTANQAWQAILNEKPNKTGKLPQNATLDYRWVLSEKFEIPQKTSDLYMQFPPLK